MLTTTILACAAAQFAAPPEARLTHDPMHPLADAAGWVVSIGAAGPVDPFPAGGDLPSLPNWPVNLNQPRPLEGAVLIPGEDGQPDLLFATGKTVHLWNMDATPVSGWPITIAQGSRIAGGPSFGDLDGDGDGEIVVCADDWPNGDIAWTFAFNRDGTPVDGFPAMSEGDHSRSPTVTDLDGDGSAEIIIGERQWPLGRVYVFDGDGSMLPGWPADLDHVPASSAGAADLDGDGVKEIVYESYESIYAFNLDGTIQSGFPYTPNTGDVFSYSAPVFADVDADGLPEIVIGGHQLGGTSHVFLINGDGTDLPGWPRPASWWVYAPPTVADIDADPEFEIIVGDQVASLQPTNRVYAWNIDGTNVDGWPTPFIQAINAQVAVADIDGDGDPELIWDDNTTESGLGKLVGFHHTGESIDGWPIITDGTTFFNTVTITDADGDGGLDLQAFSGAIQTADTTVYFWDLPGQNNTQSVQMPMFQYGPGRDGLVPSQGCPADFNGDGELNILDFVAFQQAFSDQDPSADCDANGQFNILDFICFQELFQAGCP